MGQLNRMAVIATVFNILSTLFVILRMISRMGILKKSSIDDYLVVSAVIFAWLHTGSIYAQAHFGAGKHIEQVPFQYLSDLLLSLWVGLPLYNMALALAKVSALCQLLRFFTMRPTRMLALVLIAVVSAFGIAISIASIFACNPINAFWSGNEQTLLDKCIDLRALWYTNAGFNIGTDIAVVGLPLYVLKDLHMVSKVQKWAVNAIFLIGGVACVTSILRLWTIYRENHNFDFTYIIGDSETWCAIEVNTAIICTCMQSLKPLLGKVSSKWRTQRQTSHNTSSTTPSTGSTIKMKEIWRLNIIQSHRTGSAQDSTMTGMNLNGASYFEHQNASKTPLHASQELEILNGTSTRLDR